MPDCSDNESSGSSDVEFDGGDDPEVLVCLLCEKVTSTVQDFLDHLKNEHNWDLVQHSSMFDDQYSWISFVNWVRTEVCIFQKP